jgi:hypothetical protein
VVSAITCITDKAAVAVSAPLKVPPQASQTPGRRFPYSFPTFAFNSSKACSITLSPGLATAQGSACTKRDRSSSRMDVVEVV